MQFAHLLLALFIIIIWGINFVFLKISLDQMSPLLLCAVRFTLTSIPAIFFIKRPAVAFRWVIMYGLTMFALVFLFVFIAMHAGVSPGLAALILQLQVFFTLFFAALWWHEMPSLWQILGALISFVGIGLIATHIDHALTFSGIFFTIAASAFWGIGNIITKSMGKVNIIALVAWGSFIASIPMIFLSLYFDGIPEIIASYDRITWQGVFSVLFIVYGATWIGYGVWNWLLHRYPVTTVAPFTLLVPITALVSSSLILAEPLQLWKVMASILVICGLCVNLIGSRYYSRKKEPAQNHE